MAFLPAWLLASLFPLPEEGSADSLHAPSSTQGLDPPLLCISLRLSRQVWGKAKSQVSLGNNCYLVNLVNVNQCLRTFAMSLGKTIHLI